jgi:hypothetical protein
MKDYEFKWKPELQFAAITYIVFIGGEFLRTDTAPESWGAWAVATAVAGARMVVAGLVPRLAALIGRGV